jgi:hypothetical protein
MKATIAALALGLALAGCAGPGGQNLAGFPIDEGCAAFHASSPLYGGNRALAYATNCVSVGGM